MKKTLILITFIFAFVNSKAQVTTATDFTANDCNSISHHLFAELDAGKVVVVAFVMPCSACIGPSLTAYNVATSFASSNPGRVKFFLSDDLANTSCSIVSGWATNNSITPDAVFSTTDFI